MSRPHVECLSTLAHRSGWRATSYTALLVGAFLGLSIMVAAPGAYAAQGPVGLGTAKSFAVLAGSGITNTGPTTITGNVGTFPTTSETGFGSVTLIGTNHRGDAVTQGAKSSLVTAYNDAAGRTPVTNVPVELGGSTLLAGVYTSPTFGLTGTLTLDAKGNPDAMFIFQAGSTLITESNSRVELRGSADPCNVVWQVGSSATFKTATHFVGDVLAYTSITAQTTATFQGRLLARNGAVTLDTNVITAANCAASVPAPTGTPPKATKPGGVHSPGTIARHGGGSPTGTSTPATGSGPGTPGKLVTDRFGTPVPPTHLPHTGVPTFALVTVGCALLGLGFAATIAGRRNRQAHAA